MRIISPLLLSLFVLACTSGEPEATREYTFLEDSQIVPPDSSAPLPIATVEPGENLVFRYEYDIPSDPDLADSGFSEILLFEVDAGLSGFDATDSDLAGLNAYYRQICFCATNDSFPVTGGRISGRRLSESVWEIEIDVVFEYGFNTKELQVSGTFRKR